MGREGSCGRFRQGDSRTLAYAKAPRGISDVPHAHERRQGGRRAPLALDRPSPRMHQVSGRARRPSRHDRPKLSPPFGVVRRRRSREKIGRQAQAMKSMVIGRYLPPHQRPSQFARPDTVKHHHARWAIALGTPLLPHDIISRPRYGGRPRWTQSEEELGG